MSTSSTRASPTVETQELEARLRRIAERLVALAEEAAGAGLDRTEFALRQAHVALVEEAWSRYGIEL